MSLIEIVVPVASAPPPATLKPAPRGGSTAGARLALVVNGKPRARELLERIAARLVDELGLVGVEVVTKAGASTPLTPDEAAAIAARSDLALAGLGDCGACSACSLHDALQLERLGVPASLLMTDVFQGSVASFAASLGAAGYPTVVVPHPVSSRDDATLDRLARDAAPIARERLTVAWTSGDDGPGVR